MEREQWHEMSQTLIDNFQKKEHIKSNSTSFLLWFWLLTMRHFASAITQHLRDRNKLPRAMASDRSKIWKI